MQAASKSARSRGRARTPARATRRRARDPCSAHAAADRPRAAAQPAVINGLSRIEERLEVTLWELAYRFGRVTPDGIVLDLPLTHSQMSEMVAAQRPSVSTAFTRLQDHGRIVQAARHRWLLVGEPPPTLSSLARQTGLAP